LLFLSAAIVLVTLLAAMAATDHATGRIGTLEMKEAAN
jgi:hypothetical protein